MAIAMVLKLFQSEQRPYVFQSLGRSPPGHTAGVPGPNILLICGLPAFPPAEARRIIEKLEIHYTPKHGSWLNMAENSGTRAWRTRP